MRLPFQPTCCSEVPARRWVGQRGRYQPPVATTPDWYLEGTWWDLDADVWSSMNVFQGPDLVMCTVCGTGVPVLERRGVHVMHTPSIAAGTV